MLNSKEKLAKFKDEVIISTSELNSLKRELQFEDDKLDRLKRNKEIHKEKKLIMTTKGLQKYLKKHAQKGEKLILRNPHI